MERKSVEKKVWGKKKERKVEDQFGERVWGKKAREKSGKKFII